MRQRLMKEGKSVKWQQLPPNCSRKSFLLQWMIFLAAFSLTTVFGILELDWTGYNTVQMGLFGINIQCILMMIFAGMFGYVAAMSSAFLIFVYAVVVRPEEAYFASIYLLAAILFSLAGQKRVFASWKKTLLFWPIATFLMALLSLLLTMLQSYTLVADHNTIAREYLLDVVSQILQCGVSTYVCRLFFKCCPDKVKSKVALGLLYYNHGYETDERLRKAMRKNVIGSRVSTFILAEAVILVVSAIAFTRILFPDLQRMQVTADPGDPAQTESEIQRDTEGDAVTTLEEISEMTGLDVEEIRKAAGVLESGDYVGFVSGHEIREALRQQVKEMLPEIGTNAFVYNAYSYAYILKMILMLFCVSVPVASFVNFYAQIKIAGPISRISDYMVRFSSTPRKDLRHCVDNIYTLQIHTRDEIEQLYHAVDQTVHEVTDMIDRIQEEAKLQEDLRVAQKASEAKSLFLSNMSHEIRTPINAVLGLNEMILRETEEPVTKKHAFDIKTAGNTLLSLVNDILDFSRIEAGKMEILPVQYELSSTMNDLVNMIATRAAEKNLDLIVHVEDTIPHLLYGDEVRIKQCVTNILANAVKYTEQGSVTLNVTSRPLSEEEIALRFQVIDTGIGIREEDLEKLYSPFERIEEIRNRTIEGTGLGMSIVKKILAMMDTRLEVKSVYGEGSDFSFEVRQKVCDAEPIGDFEENYNRAVESAETYQEAFHAPEAKVLIVDDTKMNLTVMEGLLTQTLLQITTAQSGMEMLKLTEQEKYDVILLDHRMPEMDGIETLTALKAEASNPNRETPVIALTANAVAGAREMYLEAGFSDYLTKPVDAEKLEKTLAAFLPDDKLILPNDPRFAAHSSYKIPEQGMDANGYLKGNGVDTQHPLAKEADRQTHELLLKCEGIHLKEAVKNCGNEGILYDAIKEFLIALPAKSEQIDRYAQEKDFRNYTVLVHALKSSARLIGAKELSEQAAYLETCGNEQNADEIAEKTPELLALYRSYLEKLSPVNPAVTRTEMEKPQITEEEFAEAVMGLKEFVEAYDFDSADKILKMLEAYKIPSPLNEKYAKIKELMAAVDRTALLELL